MHRTPTIAGLVLAGSISLLALSACAERNDGEDTLAGQEAAPAEGAVVQPAPEVPAPAAGQAQGGQFTENDRAFLGLAIAANQHEIEAARLGVERAGDAEVKQYAERMVRDHAQLGERVQPLAQQAGVSAAPGGPGMPTLESASGEAFDRAFIEMMVSDHQRAVSEYKRAGNEAGYSTQVQAVALEALPTLEAHLQDAQILHDRLTPAQDNGAETQ